MVLEALEKFSKPDLVLMDIGLSGSIDGIETPRWIREHYDIPILIPAIFLSLDK
jgi:CheY-like chemotaxis protein